MEEDMTYLMNIKQARYVAILLKNEIEEHFLGDAVYSGAVAQAISEMLDLIDADLVQDAVARMEHETCPECGWVK
jgi:hypothetical protein